MPSPPVLVSLLHCDHNNVNDDDDDVWFKIKYKTTTNRTLLPGTEWSATADHTEANKRGGCPEFALFELIKESIKSSIVSAIFGQKCNL